MAAPGVPDQGRGRRAGRGRRLPRRDARAPDARGARRDRRRPRDRDRPVEPGDLDRADPRDRRASGDALATRRGPGRRGQPAGRRGRRQGTDRAVHGVDRPAADQRRDRGPVRGPDRRPRRRRARRRAPDARDRRADGHAGGAAPGRRARRSGSRSRSGSVRAPMRTLAILPVKSFSRAKQRLRGDLDAASSRESLAEAMFADVLEALAPRPARRARSSSSPRRRAPGEIARDHGATCSRTTSRGTTSRPRSGIAAALDAGCERVLLVPGDCPALDPDELDELLARPVAPPSVLIVPDRHGTGTNALLLTPPDALAPSFGPGSCRRHVELARARRRPPPRSSRCPSLALDVDTPEDLSRARRRPPSRAARARTSCCHGAERDRARGAAGDRPRRRPRRPDRDALRRRTPPLSDGDVLVIAHKVVSKAEGRIRRARRRRARRAGASSSRERSTRTPGTSRSILDESREVLRARSGVLICVTHHGFVCANAGVDASNVPGEDALVLLPLDPDALGARAARPDPRADRRRTRRS